LAARRTGRPVWIPWLESAPVSEKRVALKRSPHRQGYGHWMPADRFPACPIGSLAIEDARECAASGDLPRRPRLQAIIIVWIQRFDPGSATPVAFAARASTPRPDRQFGFMRLDRRSWVMMCPEPAGRLWTVRYSRSPPWCRHGSADSLATTVRSELRSGRGSRPADRRPVRPAPS
jgi:hypothetical protein